MTASEKKQLMANACKVRMGVIESTYGAKSGHPGGSLSASDLFTYLYFREMKVDPADPKWEERDRFVLSKGHTAPGLYAALALKGKTVSIRRTDAHLPQGQYFDQELVGLRVIDCATGGEIGVIDRVLIYPAHRIYQVKGQREYLIPAVPGVFIESTDPDAGEMWVHLMKGLATDEN